MGPPIEQASLPEEPVSLHRAMTQNIANGTDEKEEEAQMQLFIAEMESRLREFINNLVEPSIVKVNQSAQGMDTLVAVVTEHTRSLQEVKVAQFKAVEQVLSITSFKEDMLRWDQQRRAQEIVVDEKVESMSQKLQSFQYNLEQKESVLMHTTRSMERLAIEVNRLIDMTESTGEHSEERFDDISLKVNHLRSENEATFAGIEMKLNALHDEIWGEETGLARVSGEVHKMMLLLKHLESSVEDVRGNQVDPAELQETQSQARKMLHEANVAVSSLRQEVGTVVDDVREQFRTVSETLTKHTSTFVCEIRREYQNELRNAAKLREEVLDFMKKTDESVAGLHERVGETDTKTADIASELRDEVEELNRRRKRDKTSADTEMKVLKRRIGEIFDNSECVYVGVEHIYNVMKMIIEGESLQCRLEMQDCLDRKRIGLLGVKDDESYLSRTTATEPQRPRPECRVKTVNGVPSPEKPGRKMVVAPPVAPTSHEPVLRVDSRCLGCSGQAPFVLSAFKMACLQYTSSPIEYRGEACEREVLLQERARILEMAQTTLEQRQSPKEGNLAASPGRSPGAQRNKQALAEYALPDCNRGPASEIKGSPPPASARLPALSPPQLSAGVPQMQAMAVS